MRRIGVELNASVLRAVSGSPGEYPAPVAFDSGNYELPLILNLEKSTAELGAAPRSAVRVKSHLMCRNFLAHLGSTSSRAPRWHVGRHRLDAEGALALVWQRLQPLFKSGKEVVATLPGYASVTEAAVVHRLASKAKINLVGSLSAPLAAAVIGYAEQAWVTSTIVVDVDDHALTLTHIVAQDGQARIQEAKTVSGLALKVWTEKLLNSLADVCIWQTRRDPRDTPTAEQGIHDQLEGLLDASLQGKMVQIGVQGPQWYQNILVTPDQTVQFCGQLFRTLQAEIERFLQGVREEEAPVFLLTQAASRLPGLVRALRHLHEVGVRQAIPARTKPKTIVEDFGEDLLAATGQALAGVVILSPDALARAAHAFDPELGEHQEDAAALPLPLPVDAGPARLLFQGQNHYLSGSAFTLGSHAGCQLLFDPQRYPEVAGWHCEIYFQQRSFVLNNRSREGTLVNDGAVHHSIVLQAGDWIRLGSHGPVLRFLGEDPWQPRATTA